MKQFLPPIVYEDESLLAFNKPAGLLVAPDRWDKSRPSLMRMVHAQLSPHYFNVHRLDFDTSGVLVCAKNRPVLIHLCALFASRKVEKRYLALVRGTPPADRGDIDEPLAPDPRQPGRMCVAREGRPALTSYEVLERWRGHSLLRLCPHTGRQHQLRVHLAAIGCPLLADPFYGDGCGLFLSTIKPGYRFKTEPERPLIGRAALHAERVIFPHPVTGARLTIEAPWPKDFQIAVKYLRRFAGISQTPVQVQAPPSLMNRLKK